MARRERRRRKGRRFASAASYGRETSTPPDRNSSREKLSGSVKWQLGRAVKKTEPVLDVRNVLDTDDRVRIFAAPSDGRAGAEHDENDRGNSPHRRNQWQSKRS